MSWRWLIDVRGDKTEIDWLRLGVAFVLGELIAGLLVWLLAESLGPLAMIVIAVPIAAVLIGLDAVIRRRDTDEH